MKLAQSLAGLLSPEPGSMIIGSHVGLPEKGYRTEGLRNSEDDTMFCHSPQSWTDMWDEVFKKGTVKVKVFLHEVRRKELEPSNVTPDTKFYLLVWSVTRL